MKCPFCQNKDTGVKDSRCVNHGTSIRRRRSCSQCNAKFTTLESIQLKALKVLKQDGTCQEFDNHKLKRSIEVAMRKRPTSKENVDKLINSVMQRLENSHSAKITTKLIGKTVMDALFLFDKVAFVRFASVYMNFKDENAFISLIQGVKH